MKARIEWNPHDCWVGCYWERFTDVTHIYFCLIPCFPLHIWWMAAPGDGE